MERTWFDLWGKIYQVFNRLFFSGGSFPHIRLFIFGADSVNPQDDDTPPSDGSLVRSIRDGDGSAANNLFERYIAKLDKLAGRQLASELSGRLDSEDITQSVFRTFFRRIGEGQYDVPEGETIWKLLAVITLNKIRTVGSHHRAAKRDIRKSSAAELSTLGNAVSTDENALRVLHLTIQDVVGSLPEKQQKIIQLRLEGHEIAAIAEMAGRSKRTVERVLQGFRADLQRAIEDPTEDEQL